MKISNPAGNKNVQLILFTVLLGLLLLVKLMSGYNPDTNEKTIRIFKAHGESAMKDVRV